MDNKLSQSIKVGIKYGLVIAIIYLILGFAGLWLNMTPAMKSYSDNVAQYTKNIMNSTYSSSYPYPAYYSPPMPQPPIEYYINMLLGLLSLAITVFGLLAIGILAIRSGGLAKYSLKDVTYIGVFAGAGAFVPYFIADIIQTVAMYFWNGSSLSSITSIIPGLSTLIPFAIAAETFCCCLPAGIIIFIVFSTIGACGYAYFAKIIEDKPTPV